MLTRLLIRLLVPDAAHPERPPVRLAYGLLSGYVGIAVNLLLFGVKLSIGMITGSVAIAADALNNLSDSGNSIISVVGFRLSAKPADNEHPFGHGRMEYIAALIISVIIVAVGLNFLKESITRIFRPETLDLNGLAIGILAGTLLLKVWLFFFYRHIGRKIDSRVLTAAAFDSLSDLAATTMVLIALLLSPYTSLPLDGIAGGIVALLVVWGGIGILRENINPLVGERPAPELVDELRERLLKFKAIRGVHDIILHNYGPNLYFATAHAEVNRDQELMHIHDDLEEAEVEIARTMPVRLILHCDPYEIEDPWIKLWRSRAEEAVSDFDAKFKLYDFRLEEQPGQPRRLHFHLLVPRNYALSYEEISRCLERTLRHFDPTLQLHIEFLNAYI